MDWVYLSIQNGCFSLWEAKLPKFDKFVKCTNIYNIQLVRYIHHETIL